MADAFFNGPTNLIDDPTWSRFEPTREYVAHNLRRSNPRLASTVETLTDA